MEKISPCIKWAGGKTQLIGEIQKRLPQEYNRYFEPFIGSGAVLFSIQPQTAFINDYNEQLYNLFTQVRDNVEPIIDMLTKLENEDCTKEFYYSTRDKFNEKIGGRVLDYEAAALFIYINKRCFNGLFRVNAKGLFNVPWNQKRNGQVMQPENLRSMSEYLKGVEISCGDFEPFCDNVQSGDFVYFDSPYIPESDTADFTSYTAGGFSYEDHVRLAKLYKRLSDKGALVMLSNNDVPLVHELYDGFNIESLEVKRMINSNANKRTGREVIITNYEYKK